MASLAHRGGRPGGRRRTLGSLHQGLPPPLLASSVLRCHDTLSNIRSAVAVDLAAGPRQAGDVPASGGAEVSRVRSDGGFTEPALQGYRLDWGRYELQAGLGPLAGRSRVLGLDLWVDSECDLRMRDAATGENLRSADESVETWREAQARAERTEDRVDRAETRAEQADDRAEEP